jgi:mono/diheme cytochrome c family protein
VKDSRKTSIGIAKRLVRASGVLLLLSAGPALAYDSWIEDHVAATRDYVLIKGPATARTVMLAAEDAADADAAKGKSTFDAKCALCHSMGAGDKIGPDLKGVTRRHPDQWLTWWLLETDRMQKTDPQAKALLAKYKTPMPNLELKPSEVRELLRFLHRSDGNGLAKN